MGKSIVVKLLGLAFENRLRRFAGTFSRKVDERTVIPVHFMGVWDSLKAAGLLRWICAGPTPGGYPTSAGYGTPSAHPGSV